MSARREYIDVGEVQAHFVVAGPTAGYPVLLLHQVPSSSAMWEAVMEPLASRGYRAIALDIPGYGMSDPIAQDPSLEDYADHVAMLLDRLHIRNCAIVGHHTGAAIGLTLTGRNPQVVSALALWGIPLMESVDALRLAREEPPSFSASYASELSGLWERRWRLSRDSVASHVVRRSVAEALICGLRKPDGHRAVGRANTLALVRSLAHHPVLAMCGSREMLRDNTIRSSQELPNSTLVDIRDLGMDAFDEEPEELVGIIDTFFRQHLPPQLSPQAL